MYLKVVLHLHLTAEPPMFLLLATGEEARFGRQYFTSALQYLALAHSAGTLSAAGGRQINILGSKRRKKRFAGRSREHPLAVVDIYGDLARGRQFGLGEQKHAHENQCYDEEHDDP